MTITKLIKRLEALRAKHGNVKVCVDHDSLWTGNGTFNICDVSGIDVSSIRIADGDGFTVINKDGSERERTCAVIKG